MFQVLFQLRVETEEKSTFVSIPLVLRIYVEFNEEGAGKCQVQDFKVSFASDKAILFEKEEPLPSTNNPSFCFNFGSS